MLHNTFCDHCVIMHLATDVQFNNKINADQQKKGENDKTAIKIVLTIMYEIELCLIAV